ncbi:unnamed protein product, partial [Musa hybrid cultivar]
HDSGREKSCSSPSVGQWNIINKEMVNGGTIEYWTCFSFSSHLGRTKYFGFVVI